MDLNIAEILFESGKIKFRYSRYLAENKTKWIRHGLFRAYYETGVLASEGEYENGLENRLWRDFHENGKLAAEGEYKLGKKNDTWKYWDSDDCLKSESVGN